MLGRLEQWTDFLSIDEETRATLNEFIDVVTPHMETIMDAVYARITASDAGRDMFKSPESMARARAKQQRHWLRHVFTGNFDSEYWQAARMIGQAHYRLGVELRFYMGAYSVVLSELVHIVTAALSQRPADQNRYLSALSRAIFLDMGLATSVYYDAVHGALEEMARELNFSLARAGEFRDNETGKHITRMSRMCSVLALAIGKDEKWAQMLQVASPLHDVGKIGIPDHVLLKPGRLSPAEMDVMREHPAIGGRIIPEHASDVIRMARRVSLTHHERWDGSGYPAGLQGEEIPVEGRIAAICDVYDALVSSRPYKPAWPREKAQAYLKEHSGSHFEPRLVAAFLAIMPEIDAIQAEFSEAAATASAGRCELPV